MLKTLLNAHKVRVLPKILPKTLSFWPKYKVKVKRARIFWHFSTILEQLLSHLFHKLYTSFLIQSIAYQG
jgi:hypothetical protein